MGGFSNVVCTKNFVIGPKCSEKILESSGPEQEDCLENAKLYSYYEYYRCRSANIAKQKVIVVYNACGGSPETALIGPLSLVGCTDNIYIGRALHCYCSSLAGSTCITCPVQGPDETPPETVDPDKDIRETVVEQRLPTIGIPNSAYDIPIPKVFGTITVDSNIIWLGEGRVTEQTTRLVTGDTVNVTVTEFGSVDFALGMCAGEIGNISRIWLNDVLVFNNTTGVYSPTVTVHNQEMYDAGFRVEVHKGSPAQQINPLMAAQNGFGMTPAYRDMAYLLFQNYPLTFSSASIPTVTIEVQSDVDTSVRVYTSTDAETFVPSLFGVDPVSLRLAGAAGSWIDILDLTNDAISELSAATLVQVTDQGDFIVTEDATHLKVVSGRQRTESASLTVATDNAHFASLSFLGATNIVMARGTDIRLFKWNVGTLALTDATDYLSVTGGAFKSVLAANFSYGADTDADFKYVAIAQDGNVIKFHVGNFVDAPVQYVIPGIFHDAMVDVSTGSIILFTLEGSDVRARQIRFHDDNVIETVWNKYLPEYVPNVSAARFFEGIRRYDFITTDAIYSMDLDTGTTTTLGSLLDAPTPSTPLAQFYDGQRGYIVYTAADNTLVKVFPDLRVGTGANLQNVLEYMDESVTAATLSDVVFGGFMLKSQATAQEAVDQLTTFFNLVPVDTGVAIKITSIADSLHVDIDVDAATLATTVRGQVVDDITGVKVTYFGENGNDTQTVRRDVLAGFDDYVANVEEEEHVIPIATTALIARQAAERILLRHLQRASTFAISIAPSQLALEPGDYISTDIRVGSITLDTTLVGAVAGALDAQDIYIQDPGLDGISSVPTADPSILGDRPPLRVYPLLLNQPPTTERPGVEQVYVGLLDPDSDDFTPAEIFLRTEGASAFLSAGTPTAEIMAGRLITPPLAQKVTPHTTDYASAIVIEFNKDVTAHIQNVTHDELRATDQVNMLFVGNEVLQYTRAEVVGGTTVTFHGLVRGKFGSDTHMADHAVGELCILYTPQSILTAPITVQTAAITVLVSNGGLSRYLDVPFDTYLDKSWGVGAMLIKHTDGDLWFRMPTSAPFENSFQENAQVNGPSPVSLIYVLRDRYDAATFATKVAEGGWPIANIQTVSTNDYIVRVFQYHGPLGEGGDDTTYKADTLAFDGFPIDGAFNFAGAANNGLNAPLGPVSGFYTEAGTHYPIFKSTLKVVL